MELVMNELENGEVCRLIWNREDRTEVYKKLKIGLDNWWNRELIKEKEAIVNSSSSKLYKEMIPGDKAA